MNQTRLGTESDSIWHALILSHSFKPFAGFAGLHGPMALTRKKQEDTFHAATSCNFYPACEAFAHLSSTTTVNQSRPICYIIESEERIDHTIEDCSIGFGP